ncbi:MAG: hypothetical protein JW927_01375 [Deltaproteobacteria bacterium]|nr:hypothetical protein [Deltaproteobacteria bacterium]
MDRLKRFEYCGNKLFSYIEEVLKLLPDKKEEFLSDVGNGTLQVVCSDEIECGSKFTFSKPVKSIIYLNYKTIKIEAVRKGVIVDEFLFYCIAHEIAHYFAGKGESWLWEKEANDWLRKWGNGNFDKLIKDINYQASVDEDTGYKDGYDFALKKDKEILWNSFNYYINDMNTQALNNREEIEIVEQIKNETIFFLLKIKSESLEFIKEEKKDNKDYFKGISFGIMKRVREISKEKYGQA